MAEITKVTTPMIPRENVGSKNRPATEQTFELNNPGKVIKPKHDNKTMDRETPGSQVMRDNLGRAAIQPLLKDAGDLMYNIHKMVALLEMGISASDVMMDPEAKALLEQLFVSPEQLQQLLEQQDKSSVLFKSDAFDVLRDIIARFDNTHVRDSVVNLLKSFEYHVNSENSIKTILLNCENLLDYMFSADRQQFGNYLDGLTEMLLPDIFYGDSLEQVLDAQGNPVLDEDGNPVMKNAFGEEIQHLDQREGAQVLKNNLLPLLGEIVVKYHQNGRIRDLVMVVVHNIVRVDKGTPEELRQTVTDLVHQLKKVANLPDKFEQNLWSAIQTSVQEAKSANNDVMEKLSEIIARTLHSPGESSPQALRQAETLLLSLLQNQSSMMDVLHFMLPMQTPEDRLFAELYVDPESNEGKAKNGESCRKLFLSVESENHGMLELSFLQTGEKVEFNMWVPEKLLGVMGGLRRTVSDLMQLHGYSMSGFKVQEMKTQHSIAEVFPKLLNRKVGIDVRV